MKIVDRLTPIAASVLLELFVSFHNKVQNTRKAVMIFISFQSMKMQTMNFSNGLQVP